MAKKENISDIIEIRFYEIQFNSNYECNLYHDNIFQRK